MEISTHTISIVPRYCETDQAGVVHHGAYPAWLEMGRTELLRANGYAYRDLERSGVGFVVVELSIRYKRPAFYDEELKLTTTCTGITSARVEHEYVLEHGQTGVIVAEGRTVLACVDRQGKLRRVPDFMLGGS